MYGSKSLARVLKTLLAVTYTAVILVVGMAALAFVAQIGHQINDVLYDNRGFVDLIRDMSR